jgi:hypothetical protein
LLVGNALVIPSNVLSTCFFMEVSNLVKSAHKTLVFLHEIFLLYDLERIVEVRDIQFSFHFHNISTHFHIKSHLLDALLCLLH